MATIFQDEFEGTAGLKLSERSPEVGTWNSTYQGGAELKLSGGGLAVMDATHYFSVSEPFTTTSDIVTFEVDMDYPFPGSQVDYAISMSIYDAAEEDYWFLTGPESSNGFALTVYAYAFGFMGFVPVVETTALVPALGLIYGLTDVVAQASVGGTNTFRAEFNGNEVTLFLNDNQLWTDIGAAPILPPGDYRVRFRVPAGGFNESRISRVAVSVPGDVETVTQTFWGNLIGTQEV
jgi:hypothetical protein